MRFKFAKVVYVSLCHTEKFHLWSCIIGICLFWCLTASTLAQTVSPSSATLPVTNGGDSVNQIFAISTGENVIEGIYLCLPECSGDDVGITVLSSPDSAESAFGAWSIEDDCVVNIEMQVCQATVTYRGDSSGQSTAQLQVVVSNEASDILLNAFLTGELVARTELIRIEQQTWEATEGSQLRIPVSRTVTPCCNDVPALTVPFQINAGSTATNGADYELSEGLSLAWGAGDSDTKSLLVDLLPDLEVESLENLTLTIDESALAAGVSVENGRVFIDILDAPPQVGTVQFLASSIDAVESDGSVTLRVIRTGGVDGELTATIRTSDRSALAGADYTALDTTLRWDDGDSSDRTLIIDLLTDEQREPAETLAVSILSVTGGEGQSLPDAIGNPRTAVVTVSDTQSTENEGVFVTIVSDDDQSAMPGDFVDDLTVRVTNADGAAITGVPVQWRVIPDGAARLLRSNPTITDAAGQSSIDIEILSRGFIRVVAAATASPAVTDALIRPAQPDDNAMLSPRELSTTPRIAAPPITLASNEAAFVIRVGIGPAPGLNENQAEIGRVLDTVCESLDVIANDDNVDAVELSDAQEDLRSTCASLENQLTGDTLGSALNRLLPEELFTLGESAVETTDLQVSNVFTRLQAVQAGQAEAFDFSGLQINYRGQGIPGVVIDMAQDTLTGGAASSDTIGFSTRFGFFVNGLVSSGEVDSGENQKSSEFSTRGLTLGADYRLSAATVVGAALGFSSSESTFTADDDEIDSDGISLSLFGTWYKERSAYADIVLDVGRNDYSIRRRIDLPGASRQLFAQGDTDADTMALSLGAGRTFQRDTWEFAPYARVSLAQARVAAYSESSTESGAGSGSVLQIDDHTVRSATFTVGGRASVSVSTRRAVILPQLQLEAEFENETQKDPIKARFRHDPTATVMRVVGNERDSAYLKAGMGARIVFPRRRSGYLFYELRTAHDLLTQQSLKLGIRLDF